MTPFQEKICFGLWLAASSAVATVATYFTEGETRFLFATGSSSIMVAGFLAMVFKHPTKDTIQQVVGRCGISILGGIFATIPALHYLGLEKRADENLFVLGGVAACVCTAFFILGVQLLRRLEKKGGFFADKILKKYGPDEEET